MVYREGDDGLAGTSDDETFETLAELDAIPYVGPAAFALLLEFAVDQAGIDPFDPTSCSGPRWTADEAASHFADSAVYAPLGQATMSVLRRYCTDLSCSEWETCDNCADHGDAYPTSLHLVSNDQRLRVGDAEFVLDNDPFLLEAVDPFRGSWLAKNAEIAAVTRECVRLTAEVSRPLGDSKTMELRYALLGVIPDSE